MSQPTTIEDLPQELQAHARQQLRKVGRMLRKQRDRARRSERRAERQKRSNRELRDTVAAQSAELGRMHLEAGTERRRAG